MAKRRIIGGAQHLHQSFRYNTGGDALRGGGQHIREGRARHFLIMACAPGAGLGARLFKFSDKLGFLARLGAFAFRRRRQPCFKGGDLCARDFLCPAIGNDAEAQKHQQKHDALGQTPQPARGALAAFPVASSAKGHGRFSLAAAPRCGAA
jgi:hypothetical protein